MGSPWWLLRVKTRVGAGLSGQDPGSVAAGQAEGEQSAQVDRGDPQVKPGVVLADAAVAQLAVAAGEPGDRALDHRPVPSVVLDEPGGGGSGGVLALRRVVLGERGGASGGAGGAPFAGWAAGAPTSERRDVLVGRERDGVACGAGDRLRVLIDGEVGGGEAAGNRLAQRPGLDQRLLPGPLGGGGQRPGGIRGVPEHLDRLPVDDRGVGGQQRGADGRIPGAFSGGLRQRARGHDAGVGLDREVGLEPVLAPVHGLVRVPGVGVDGGDHPVLRDPLRDSPLTRPARLLGVRYVLDVLAGDQPEQPDRGLSGDVQRQGPRLDALLDRGQDGQRVADQPINQRRACGFVIPGDLRLARQAVVVPGRRRDAPDDRLAVGHGAGGPPEGGDQPGGGGAVATPGTIGSPSGTVRATRRMAAISWVTVSWVATASSRTVESNARRALPRTAPVAATTSRTASNTRCGRCEAASRRRQYVNTVGWNAAAVTGSPHAAFQRRSNVTASAASRSDSPCSACSTSTVATTSAGTDGRPRPDRNKSSNMLSGNSSPRCAARNANTLPTASRCPANDSTSSNSRCGSLRPCTPPASGPAPPSRARDTHFVQQSPRRRPRYR